MASGARSARLRATTKRLRGLGGGGSSGAGGARDDEEEKAEADLIHYQIRK